MSETPDALPPLAAPAAIAAFLKGVERRGAVLAELQAGEPGIGDAALTRAMAAFRGKAVEHAMATWPHLFWCELLHQPALRGASRAPWPEALPAAATPPGLRAALLLRLVAGLDEEAAAGVLGVAAGTVRRAIGHAVPRHPDGHPDAAAWARVRADLQQRVRELDTARTLRLARGREAALAGSAERFFPHPPRRHLRAAGAVAATVLLALAGTWWFGNREPSDVAVAELGPAGRPASRYSPSAGLVAHPDFALIADSGEERLAREIAFLSWSLAQGDAAVAASDPLAPVPAPAVSLVPEGETLDAP